MNYPRSRIQFFTFQHTGPLDLKSLARLERRRTMSPDSRRRNLARMTDHQRRRGRPRGTEKNDDPILAKVAALVTNEPGLGPTTAMRRALAVQGLRPEEMETTVVRRLQGTNAGDARDSKMAEAARSSISRFGVPVAWGGAFEHGFGAIAQMEAQMAKAQAVSEAMEKAMRASGALAHMEAHMAKARAVGEAMEKAMRISNRAVLG